VALAPQLMITPMDDAITRLWLTITRQLSALTEALQSKDGTEVFGEDELARARSRLRETLRMGQEGAQLNPRSRRYRLSDRRARAEAVDDLAARLADLIKAIREVRSEDELPRRDELDAAFAGALDVVLTALRDGDREPLGDRFAAALAGLDRLVGELPAIGPGRHAVGRAVDTARRFGVAAGRAIDLTLRSDGAGSDGKDE
jgi:hypothetical protein